MRAVVGHSDDPDSAIAVAEVLAQIEDGLRGDRPIAAAVYACCGFDPAALAAVRERFPGLPLVGCTTDGECSSVLTFGEDSLVLTVFASDRLRAESAVGTGLSSDLVGGVRAVWRALSAGGPPSLVVVLAESLGISGSRVVEALDAEIPPEIPVVGGTAGDQWQFRGTRQFHGGEVFSDAIVLLGFFGPLRVQIGVASGWQPMGPPARVTRSEGPLVYEIDGQSAQDWFATYFGQREQPNPEHPFAVYDPPDAESFYLRAPFQRGPEGSIMFTGDVPPGVAVRLTEATRDAILGGAADAVHQAAAGFDGDPSALLVFSCAARKQVLGTRTREEIERLRRRAGDFPLSGFYTYGEISRLAPGGPLRFHNETVVVALLGE